jgi:hypothetical protein
MKLFTCISAAFTVFAFASLAPVTALAQTCGNYPLTPAQSDALEKARLEVVVPEGEVPFVQRCDIDGNDIIDRNDILLISKHRNQPASDPDDPKDRDGNGVITLLDARGCVLACTYPRCASTGPGAGGALVNAAQAEPQNTVGQPGDCYQADDFDGDGKQDFLGVFEYVGKKTRGNNWNLETVILYEDAAGDTQVIAFPYTGQSSRSGGEIFQHLSIQPAGIVDLMPGQVKLTQPGVVSYRNNEPKTLYYFENGVLSRAFYKIDD